MTLYFLRHGSAGEPQQDAREDERRALDPEGIQQCTLAGLALSAIGVDADAIVSSPLKRAVQSAQLIARETGYEGEVLRSEALRPDATYEQFVELLSGFPEEDSILLVGHNSKLAEFLGKLISAGGRASIHLKKGAIAKVQQGKKGAVLQWCITPKLLRASFEGTGLLAVANQDSGRRHTASAGARRAASRGQR